MAPEISIITAIHNALPVNELYWNCLAENTATPFELIIIDNHSTDGSEVFFESLAAKDARVRYHRRDRNQSYPASQRQGMAIASTSHLFFVNNDVWLPKGWELPLLEALKEHPYQIVSPTGQEAQPTQIASTRLKSRWRWITRLSLVWQKLAGASEAQRLAQSLRWMYGDLEVFLSPTEDPKDFYGIKGDTVAFNRALADLVPDLWHERIEAADWHLYLTMAKLHEKDKKIPLPRVIGKSYVHHFGRYSARLKFEPLETKEPFIAIDAYWGAETVRRLWWGHQLPKS